MIIFIFTFESLFMCTGADWRAVTGHWTGSRRVGQNFYFPKNFLFFSPHGRDKLRRYRSLDSLKPVAVLNTGREASIGIFYADSESLTRGFLLHHTLRYFIPTLSLLRRVFILTHGCLPHPSSKYFTPHTSGIFRVFCFTHGCLPHPSSKYFIRTLSLLCRVFCYTIHSDILSRL